MVATAMFMLLGPLSPKGKPFPGIYKIHTHFKPLKKADPLVDILACCSLTTPEDGLAECGTPAAFFISLTPACLWGELKTISEKCVPPQPGNVSKTSNFTSLSYFDKSPTPLGLAIYNQAPDRPWSLPEGMNQSPCRMSANTEARLHWDLQNTDWGPTRRSMCPMVCQWVVMGNLCALLSVTVKLLVAATW